MKSTNPVWKGTMALLAVLIAVTPLYAAGMGPGQTNAARSDRPYNAAPAGQQGWYCPYCGAYQGDGWNMGPGMMGSGWHHGYGMGPGMMGSGQQRGYGMGPGMMGPGYGYGPQYRQPQQKPLEKEQAEAIVEDYLKSTHNPNLKLGGIKDEGQYFEAEIVTKNNNSLVDMIIVDKDTGWMRSAY